MSDLSNRSPEEIQSEIAATRHSLDRKLDELQHRLNPRERIEEVKARTSERIEEVKTRASSAVDTARERANDMLESARGRASDMLDNARGRANDMLDGARGTISDAGEKLHPRNLEPYAGWMAVGAIVSGTVMAINGWRRVQCRSADDAGDVIATTDVTIVSTDDLDRGTNLGDLPPAP